MEHLWGVASDAFTTHSSLILETHILRDKIQLQLSKEFYFVDTNSVESEPLFTEKKLAAVLSSIICPLALFLNSKKLPISFSSFERQLFQRSGPLDDIANRLVFRNVRGTEKFIKEKLVGWTWHGTSNSLRKICRTFLVFILCMNCSDWKMLIR